MVIIGGGFPPEEVQAIRTAVDGVKPLACFYADRSKAPPGATGPPPPDVIKQRLMESINAEEKGEGEWVPGLYMF